MINLCYISEKNLIAYSLQLVQIEKGLVNLSELMDKKIVKKKEDSYREISSIIGQPI
jgi:hypothetical protein